MCEVNRKDLIIMCRCEDITVDEVRAYIEQGVTDLEQLKRLLRVGMGPCQGRTCTPLIVNELARAT
ncbi:MAG: (2Fe-2S)-binding protein, partial [Firmicutes bacterium]|nr:(2Fe-2S)-binding protein [Bacillota bacterium]